MITEKQHQKWCVCAAWIYSQLGLYAWHLHVMHFQWQSTIAVYANFSMMKGTFCFLHHFKICYWNCHCLPFLRIGV